MCSTGVWHLGLEAVPHCQIAPLAISVCSRETARNILECVGVQVPEDRRTAQQPGLPGLR